MKKIVYVSLYLTLSILGLSCSSNAWIAYPDFSKYHMCDPYSGELQMIFVPGYGETVIVVEDCDQFRREKISIALRAFEFGWNHFFGPDRLVTENLRNLIITFSGEKKVQMGYTGDGSLTYSGIIEGLTISKDSVWISAPPGTSRVCETSLVHELVHASLWSKNGHGDPDHTGERFKGWTYKHYVMIDEVNQYLCTLGI